MKKSAWQIIIAVTGWTAVLLQFYLILLHRVESVGETIVRFFSFFTILTNIIVAVCFASLAFRPASGIAKFFSRTSIITAVTAYILLVGLGYQVLLRHIWDPQGLQWLVDELLHTVIPLFALLYWIFFVPKERIPFTSVLMWTIYPVLYFIFVLLRGAASGFYPYYFIDVSRLGYGGAMQQSLIMLVAFLIKAFLLAYLKRSKRPGANQFSA